MSSNGLIRISLILFLTVFAASCSVRAPLPLPENIAASALVPAANAGIIDGRSRFREIFQKVLLEHAGRAEKIADSAEFLWKIAGEGRGQGKPVYLGPSSGAFRVVIVPGLLAECVADTTTVFGDARMPLERIGYRMDYIQTRGRRGSAHNAKLIRQAVLGMPANEMIVFVTHSKGTVDTLEAIAEYPEVAGRTIAVVSFSGAVNGSPLALAFPDFMVKMLHEMPLASCEAGNDSEAMESLRRNVRISWLAGHELPKTVRYYSLAAFARPGNISRMLLPFYDILAKIDPVNDGQVLCSDMIIPGSTLLGYPNADHWAVTMPISSDKSPLMASLADKNDYPRAALLEAALRFVEEDLAAARIIQPW